MAHGDFGPHIREALATSKNIQYIGKLSCSIPITFTYKIWGLTRYRFFCHSGAIDTAVTKIGDFIVDFLREFEAIFIKDFNPCIRGLGGVDL
jgi:hypothetical protein